MKIIWIFAISFFFLGSVKAQDGSKMLRALSNGRTQAVTKHFASKVELCYGDDVFFLPKAKAAAKFSGIINTLQPVSITPLHKGASGNNSAKYIIGELKTAKGKYRLFIFAKKRGDRIVIPEIRIEPY